MTGGEGTDRSARVVYRLVAWTISVVFGRGLEDVEVHYLPWAYLQNAGRVSTSIAIIGG